MRWPIDVHEKANNDVFVWQATQVMQNERFFFFPKVVYYGNAIILCNTWQQKSKIA